MIIVEKILGKAKDFDSRGLEADRVLLDRYDMAKPHQKLKTEKGAILAVSLSPGESMYDGAVLYKDQEKIITAELLPEDVLEIFPEGNLQWARTAFNIGNMHHPAYLQDDRIMIPYDPVLESLLKGIGVHYVRGQKQLIGEKAGITVGGHGHSHGHGHQHSHHDDHSHDHQHGHHHHD